MSKVDRPSVDGLYEAVLKAMYCDRNADHRVINHFSGEVYKIGEKDVVLPAKEILVENNFERIHPFHPLCEDLLRGQSDTIRWLIKRVAAALTLRISTIGLQMLTVASSTALQGRIPDAKATAHLEVVAHAKASTVSGWGKMISNFKKADPLLNLYVSRGDEAGSNKAGFYRLAAISCPMGDDAEDNAVLCGVKLASKTDKRMLVNLINYLLPKELREFGSNGNIPYFTSIVGIFHAITKHLNHIVKPFKPLAGEIDAFEKVNVDWYSWFKDEAIDQFVGIVPELPGNVGEISLDDKRRQRNLDPELAELMGRTEIKASTATPPWNEDEPKERAVEPRPAANPSATSGINIMARDDRYEDDRDDRRRDDRDRDRGPRIDIFANDRDDRRGRRDDRYDDRDDRRSRSRYDDRRDDRDRGSRGGIDIMGRR